MWVWICTHFEHTRLGHTYILCGKTRPNWTQEIDLSGEQQETNRKTWSQFIQILRIKTIFRVRNAHNVRFYHCTNDFVLWIIIYSVFDCSNCLLNTKIIVVCVIITINSHSVCVHIHCVYIYIYIKLHIYCIVWLHVCGVILYNYFILFYTPIYSIYFYLKH